MGLLRLLFKIASRPDRRMIVYRDALKPDASMPLIDLDRDAFTLYDRGDVSTAERSLLARARWDQISDVTVFTGDDGQLHISVHLADGDAATIELAETMPGFISLCDVMNRRFSRSERSWYCDGRILGDVLPRTRLFRAR